MSDGWFKLNNDSLDIVRRHGATVFAVYSALSMYADTNGVCHPKEDTIAELLGVSRSTVQRAIGTLRDANLVRITNRVGAGGKFSSNSYKLVQKSCVTDAARNGSPCVTGAQRCASSETHKQEPMDETNKRVADFELPKELDTDQFRSAWDDWQTHQKQKRNKPTDLARTRQLSRLAKWGERRAIAAIEYSIENNYMGIFEPKQGNDGHPSDKDALKILTPA